MYNLHKKMIKKILFFFSLLLFSSTIYAQKSKIPEGFDKIILDGKVAYMNSITGEVTYNLPKTRATKNIQKKTKEYNPFITHTVKKGETLYRIARKYNISIQDIYKYNNADADDHLYIGQEIIVGLEKNGKIPLNFSSKNATFHIVKPNENLYRISLKYNLTVLKLKKLNQLKTNSINIGQKLLIR